jgi:hypothetical protein
MAHSLFEARWNAWEWFQDPFWKGPRPTPDTVFTVRGGWPGGAARLRVRAKSFIDGNGTQRSQSRAPHTRKKRNVKDERVIATTLPHSDFGAPDCCGCLNGIAYGGQAVIVCNECLAEVQTVPVAELEQTLHAMELGLEVADCPVSELRTRADRSRLLGTCGVRVRPVRARRYRCRRELAPVFELVVFKPRIRRAARVLSRTLHGSTVALVTIFRQEPQKYQQRFRTV